MLRQGEKSLMRGMGEGGMWCCEVGRIFMYTVNCVISRHENI